MEVWEFGEINEGDVVDTVFTFKNVGNEPLIISNAKGRLWLYGSPMA